jgi:HSP20 family protein
MIRDPERKEPMRNLVRPPELQNWDPFAIAEELMRWSPFGAEGSGRARALASALPCDLVETEHGFEIEADMPGIAKEDLDITVTGNQVQISGERRASRPGDARYHVAERYHGKFIRSFTLPSGADPDNVHANLEDGVLKLSIPKRPEARSRKVSLTGGVEKKQLTS